jgi:ABC-type transport system substrate-binding protein
MGFIYFLHAARKGPRDGKEPTMSHDGAANGLSRRDLIRTGALAAGAAAVLPPRPAVAQLKTVPRNRTLSLVWIGSREGRWVDFELWNPYAIGSNHQNGPGILYEPLAYYSAFADKELLWLAESYRYSPDFKELTIKTRSGIKWSDGAPFSAEDVAFTLTSWGRRCGGASTSSSSCRKRGRPTPARSS